MPMIRLHIWQTEVEEYFWCELNFRSIYVVTYVQRLEQSLQKINGGEDEKRAILLSALNHLYT